MVSDVVKGMNDWFEDMNSFIPPPPFFSSIINALLLSPGAP